MKQCAATGCDRPASGKDGKHCAYHGRYVRKVDPEITLARSLIQQNARVVRLHDDGGGDLCVCGHDKSHHFSDGRCTHDHETHAGMNCWCDRFILAELALTVYVKVGRPA